MTTISFKSTEIFDYKALKTIYDNWDSIQVSNGAKDSWDINGHIYVPKCIIRSYLSHAIRIDKTNLATIDVNYKHSFIRKKLGRQFAVRGLGLQSFNRWFRHTICHEIYQDIDIVNAHPNLLYQYAINQDYIKKETSELKKYIDHREQYLEEIMKQHNFSRDDSKDLILAVLNGADRYSPIPWFAKFKKEIDTIHDKIYNDKNHIEIVKSVKNDKKRKFSFRGSVCNHILCQLENNVLISSINFLNEHNIPTKNIVLCFDGFMLPKEAFIGMRQPLDNILQQLEAHVFKDTTYNLTFKKKEMTQILNLEHLKCNMDESLQELSEKGNVAQDDTEAGEILLKNLEGKIFICQNQIFIKLEHNQTWTNNQIQVENELLLQVTNLSIYKYSDDGLIKPYSRNTFPATQIVSKAKLLAPRNDNFDQLLFQNSLYKIFFKNGVYDFKEGKFRSEKIEDMTAIRLDIDFPKETKTESDLRVMEVFMSIFNEKEIVDHFLGILARGLAGCYQDKNYNIIWGPRNCGKGVITEMLQSAFKEYVGIFDANNLLFHQHQNQDEALMKKWIIPLRWSRLVIGNEQNPSSDGEAKSKMNGILLKSLSSGGDPQVVRGLYESSISFIFGGRIFLFVNEIPMVIPNDTTESVTLFQLKNKFVDSIDGLNENEKKFMILKNAEIKDEVRSLDFSNSLIKLILNSYSSKIRICKKVTEDTKEFRIDQGDEYSFFKTYFKITNNPEDRVTTEEIKEIATTHKLQLSAQKIKQILNVQYGLKTSDNVRDKENKRHKGYLGILKNIEEEPSTSKKEESNKLSDVI
jgi:hypothetical protein